MNYRFILMKRIRSFLLVVILFLGVFSIAACSGSDGDDGEPETPADSNNPPIASLSATPLSGNIPLTVEFSGSGSSDPDADPLTYDWEFGDGTTLRGNAVESHIYTQVGHFTTKLTVTDDNGASATSSIEITTLVAMVTVPDVVDLSQSDAESAITDAGLVVGNVTHANSDTIDSGNIISQAPSAGTSIAAGSSVNIVVSLGPVAMVTVPDVVDSSQSAAEAAIKSAGLVVGSVTSESSGTIASGNIISQNPASGTPVTVGSSVNLVVSSGPEMVMVPNVVNSSQGAAESAITSAGLIVGSVTSANSDTIDSGNVISQNPAAGTSIASGSSVNLVVSSGPEMVTVPNVVDSSQGAAESAITSSGLVLGSVTSANSDTTVIGNIISQDPVAGTSVAEGSSVNLVVSLGPASGTVPNIVGISQTEAINQIQTAGLSVGTISSSESDTVAFGLVITQNPVQGTAVSPGASVDFTVSLGSSASIPPDPADIAPEIDRTVPTGMDVAFLYSGPGPVQIGMNPEVIDETRIAVLRGKVFERDMTPLAGVKISILHGEEFGFTRSRDDGQFDIVVNGGGEIIVEYEKSGYLPAQRQVTTPWEDYVWLPDVVLIPVDSQVTEIDFSDAMEVARGSAVTDDSGTRQATLLCPQGISAEMVLPDGTTQPLASLNVRATEYTVGDSGPEAMPGILPPTSAYTYAVEYSVDEAMASGANRVNFDSRLYHYVENFLGFNVGGIVPVGYYDREEGRWVASENGRVIKILGVDGDLAQLDTDGDDVIDDAATLDALNITSDEQRQLAALYTTGQTLWRVPIRHFSTYDCNWPFAPPGGARGPGQPKPDGPGGGEEDPCEDDARCIVEYQNQVLREDAPITGTPFSLNYRSSRVAGFAAGNFLDISLTGEELPAPLKRVELVISVAGRLFEESFSPPTAELNYTFIWDGMDAYGRELQGAQPVSIKIGYVYDGVYEAPADVENAFGGFAGTAELIDTPTRQEVIFWQELEESIGRWEAFEQGIGGWSIDVHHTYSNIDKTLHLGDGTRHSGQSVAAVIDTFAGERGIYSYDFGDGVPAIDVYMFPECIAVGPDGTVYVFENERLDRIDREGMMTTISGQPNTRGFAGDGGPVIDALFYIGQGSMDIGPDGSIYIADQENQRIRKIDPEGIITTVAGNGNEGYAGDGELAVDAELADPRDVAVTPDGGFYIAQTNKVRYVAPDGIITTVAGGTAAYGTVGEGDPALEAYVNPLSLDVGPDGCLYILDNLHRIRKVSLDGIITTVAGTGTSGYSGDGGPAVEADISSYSHAYGRIHVALDGSIYLPQRASINRLRKIDPEGIIHTIAGNGGTSYAGDLGDGGLATAGTTYAPRDVAIGPDGFIYLSTYRQIRKISNASPTISVDDLIFPSKDGKEAYIFNGAGRHLRTVEALTGALRYEFGYNEDNQLISITDMNANVTVLERDSSGNLTGIVSPYGQRTDISLNDSGYIQTVTNPMGGSWEMTYGEGGLLISFTDPNEQTVEYTYDDLGFLIKDSDPEGGFIELDRVETENGYEVPVMSAEDCSDHYMVETLEGGVTRHTTTFADGTQNILEIDPEGISWLTTADGMVRSTESGGDARFGMLASFVKSYTEETPGGLSLVYEQTRSVTYDDSEDILAPSIIENVQTLNDKTFTMRYEKESQTITRTTAEGRQIVTVLDSQGRPVEYRLTGLASVFLGYDAHGRLNDLRHGTGDTARIYSISYNSYGYVESILNPIGVSYDYTTDLLGRATGLTRPDGEQIGFSHDGRGNLLSVTPPGRPEHVFTYNRVNRLNAYDPPDVTGSTAPSEFTYNLDRQLTSATNAGDRTVTYTYGTGGRLESMNYSRGEVQYQYDTTSGKLVHVTSPDGGYDLEYDGKLITAMIWTGDVSGRVDLAYDNFFRVNTSSVNTANEIVYLYDNDGLLSGIGNLTISRDAGNGLITGSTLENTADVLAYNSFGELSAYSYTFSGEQRFALVYAHDDLGRVIEKQEEIDAGINVYAYIYDLNGRLESVTQNSVQVAAYTYDANGNRLSMTGEDGIPVASTYDNQDRLVSCGTTVYGYRADGTLMSKTNGTEVTTYHYDELGNLISVTQPDGTGIAYLIDGRNRRIGKTVDGTLVKGFLYIDKLNPIAELDGSGTVVSRFVYGTKSNVPDYMIRGGQAYRIISDHLGSPILVVDAATGSVVQQIEYDAFGNPSFPVGDPDFQPFGFAGGIYDSHTGLIRFGTRDYDPQTGRFTSKDQVLFNGGTPNLYAYLGNDPMNLVDAGGMGSKDDPCDDEGDCNGREDERSEDDDEPRYRVEARWRESSISFNVPSWADSVIGATGAVFGTASEIGIAAELGGAGAVLGVVAYPVAFEGARQTADQLAERLIEDRVNRDMQQLDEIWRETNRDAFTDPGNDDCP